MKKNVSVALYSLDAILHQPIRTQVVACLLERKEVSFMELKRDLHMTDGNLEAHLKKLKSAEYITSRKDTSGSRLQTNYLLTETGHAALFSYQGTLQKLLGVQLQCDAAADM